MQDNAQPNALDKNVETSATLPGGTRLSLDIVLPLLKLDELEKLSKYNAAYLTKHKQ